MGLRLHLRVSGDIVASIAASPVSVTYAYSWNPFAPGRATVVYDMENTGNVRVQSADTVRAAGPFGAAARAASTAEPQEVLPRSSHRLTRVVDDVWPLLRLTTTLTATPGAVGEDDLGGAVLTPVTTTATAWVVPWPQLVLVLLVVGLVLLVRSVRAHRRTAFADALARAREEGAATARSQEASPSLHPSP